MEDREIVNLYWERNSNAIKETASKYGGYCKMIAENILGNNEDAEECVNDGGFDTQKGKRAASTVCEQHTAGDAAGVEGTAKGATLSKGLSAVNRTCTLKIEYGRSGGNT